MLPTSQGSFRLFRVFGIQVFLHWTWFVLAYYRFQTGKEQYDKPIWMIWEYVALFGIVLLHEFGHSLACRSVGGRSDTIILWPFGGIAFVQPPPRPGANLWSVAAGPLVNVILVPVIFVIRYYLTESGLAPENSDLAELLRMIEWINLALLIFNILPIYPMDGGQIFQSLLWFFIGHAKSVIVAASLGIVVAVGAGGFFLLQGDYWIALIAAFLVSQAWRSLQWARQSLRNDF